MAGPLHQNMEIYFLENLSHRLVQRVNDIFENNKAVIGGLIFTLCGIIDHQKTNFSSKFINCNLKDTSVNKGLIYFYL